MHNKRWRQTLAFLVTGLSCAVALSAFAQKNDLDIGCYNKTSCEALIGERVWVVHSPLPICPTQDLRNNCTNIHVGSGLTITGVSRGQDGLPTWNFAARTNDGRTGFINGANAHLLSFKDPRPAELARKQKTIQNEQEKRAREEADAKEIAATPPQVYEKACILAAAQRLPSIPGIQIVATRANSLPPDAKETPPWLFYRIIQIDTKAAGQDATFNFLCAKGVRTPPAIESLGYR